MYRIDNLELESREDAIKQASDLVSQYLIKMSYDDYYVIDSLETFQELFHEKEEIDYWGEGIYHYRGIFMQPLFDVVFNSGGVNEFRLKVEKLEDAP